MRPCATESFRMTSSVKPGGKITVLMKGPGGEFEVLAHGHRSTKPSSVGQPKCLRTATKPWLLDQSRGRGFIAGIPILQDLSDIG